MASFLEALQARYGAADTTEYGDNAFLVGVGKPHQRVKKWEMVGLEATREKQAQHSRLSVVSLPDAGIDRAEDNAGEIKAAGLTRLVDLDLSRNPLRDLAEIETIVAALPALRELQLNGLKFPNLTLSGAWNTIRTLTLNATGLPWSEVAALKAVPNLSELHFESNGLRSITPLPQKLETVVVLSLGLNELTTWDFDETITQSFPNLRDLRVHGNQLPMPAGDLASFAPLKSLWVSDNQSLQGGEFLIWVAKQCTQLDALRVTYSTLLPQVTEAQARMLTVASLPSLQSLNNGAVRPKERLDAELFYLQRALATPEEQRAERFPRTAELSVKYASVILSKTGGEGGPAMLVLQLTFRALGKPFVSKALPSLTPISKVKSIVTTFWPEFAPDKQRLVYYAADEVGAAPPQPLDDDMQTLAYFGVGTGAIIEVLDK
jgi:Leucine-rich repeat (LRR) protein